MVVASQFLYFLAPGGLNRRFLFSYDLSLKLFEDVLNLDVNEGHAVVNQDEAHHEEEEQPVLGGEVIHNWHQPWKAKTTNIRFNSKSNEEH